jgi:hypothetical protein
VEPAGSTATALSNSPWGFFLVDHHHPDTFFFFAHDSLGLPQLHLVVLMISEPATSETCRMSDE